MGVGHHHLQALHGAGLGVHDAFAEGDRARRSGRRELHKTQFVVDALIVVGVKADLLGGEGLGAVHIRHRQNDELEPPAYAMFRSLSVRISQRCGCQPHGHRRHDDEGDVEADFSGLSTAEVEGGLERESAFSRTMGERHHDEYPGGGVSPPQPTWEWGMTDRLVYLVRHAETNWQLVNDRHLVGAANDLAPLTDEGVRQVEALVDRLRGLAPALVLSSPMARALQTAALLSRALDLPLQVEFDLSEWVPDLTYSWSTLDQVVASLEDMRRCGGEWPAGGPQPVWEPLSAVRKRSLGVLSRYVPSRGVVAAVTHGGVIESLTGQIAQLCDVVPYEVPLQ